MVGALCVGLDLGVVHAPFMIRHNLIKLALLLITSNLLTQLLHVHFLPLSLFQIPFQLLLLYLLPPLFLIHREVLRLESLLLLSLDLVCNLVFYHKVGLTLSSPLRFQFPLLFFLQPLVLLKLYLNVVFLM